MTVVLRPVCGGHIQAVMVEHTQFRRLLQQQRITPARRIWAGSRFRVWRVTVNNASQQAVDYVDCLAYMNAQAEAGDPRAKFTVIDGGKKDEPDGAALEARANPAWAGVE